MTRPNLLSAAVLAVVLAAACSRPADQAPTDPPAPPPPVEPNPPPPRVPPSVPVGTTPAGPAESCEVSRLSAPRVYGNKVKTLLTGLPMSADELARLEGDPGALRQMVEQWFADPRADELLRRFFMMAFQQDQVTGEGLTTLTNLNNTNWGRFDDDRETVTALLVDNIEQSFARTAVALVRGGRPFSEVLTTDSFAMTTALMMFYAYLDHRHVNDDDSMFTRPLDEVTSFVGLRNKADEPPSDQVLDPTSPNFLRVWLPDFATLCLPATTNEFTFGPGAVGNKVQWLFTAIVGRPDNVSNRPAGAGCRAAPASRQPLLTKADFRDWRVVRVRKPAAQEQLTRFYRLSALRAASELVLESDRVGFFTTLGFFGTWPTNEDNSSRVTLNQTLITALGASFDGTTVDDFSPPSLDEEHSGPGTPCYGCHQTMDPMRDFFRQSYSASYGIQHNPTRQNLDAVFVFRGIERRGDGVRDLGRILAEHPDFPRAWVQKLCHAANSAPCDETSPQFAAVVQSFRDSSLDFRALVHVLYSSPLVTNASCVDGRTGAQPSIARREQFCALLSQRLGLTDICGLETPPRSRSPLQNQLTAAVGSIPADVMSRGEPAPITIRETGLFTRATAEVVCTSLGESAFDPAFAGLDAPSATRKMVEQLMGLVPGDPRHEGALAILDEHVADALSAGANERNALRSALVVACMSPGVAGIGL